MRGGAITTSAAIPAPSDQTNGSLASASPIPTVVACTTISASGGTVHGSVSSAASQGAPIVAATSSALASVRLTTVIRAAPASESSAAIARAAPPAPMTTVDLPCGSVMLLSEERKPLPSVLSPMRRRPLA